MYRRSVAYSGAIAVIGLILTSRSWPDLRLLQILLPFTFGLAAGVTFNRGRRGGTTSPSLS